MPEGAVYVGRPTIWGNPFETATEFRTLLEAILGISGQSQFHQTNLVDFAHVHRIASHIYELRDKQLACWCDLNHECHADVLCELANQPRRSGNEGGMMDVSLKQLRELEAKLSKNWSVSWLSGGIRHLVRNVDYDSFWCPADGEDRDAANWPGKYEGGDIATIRNALPELLSLLDECRNCISHVAMYGTQGQRTQAEELLEKLES